ncbi:hypothetical protein F4818DRAFT_443929 [Hypoxylon cercidicola]|nr:hypothetical protein F4818DRAFT_443929 [Hypoxylon cercidicola]
MEHLINSRGLVMVDSALADLLKHPERLEHFRARFDRSPPYDDLSGASTEYISPDPRTEEEQELESRSIKIMTERSASKPREQLIHQVTEENEAILEAILLGKLTVPNGTCLHSLAEDNVKARWVEQGIWNEKWSNVADGCWKHEEPLEIPQYGIPPENPLKHKRRKTRKGRRKVFEPQTKEAPERQASRPLNQFMYQVSRAREQIQRELKVGLDSIYIPEDINTRAYNMVKETWTERGIWDPRWSILPGTSWKHERPLKQFTDDDLIEYAKEKSLKAQEDNLVLGRHPSLVNSPRTRTIEGERHVHFDLPPQSELDREKKASGRTPIRRRKRARMDRDRGKKRRSLLFGEVELRSIEFRSPSPPPSNEEEPTMPESEASQQETSSHGEGQGEDEDKHMLDVEPSKDEKPSTKGTISFRRSSKPQGIVKKWKNKKMKGEIRKKLEDRFQLS